MNRFIIVLYYGGKWVNSQYSGDKSKSMLVSHKVTYQELVKELYYQIGISPNEYGMKVHYQYKSSSLGVCNTMEIVDNEDVAS